MRHKATLAFCVALAFSTGACHGAGDPALLAGPAYSGSVTARVSPPGQASYTERGKGTARLEQANSGSRLRVVGAIVDPRGDAGFEMDGSAVGRGWRGRWGDVRLAVGEDGRISGGGIAHPQKFAFSGLASATGFDLVVDIELLAPNKGGLPRGTRMRFDYDLARRAPSGAGGAVAASGGKRTGSSKAKGCRKIRYVVRPVPDPGGGTLVMRRVPTCDD